MIIGPFDLVSFIVNYLSSLFVAPLEPCLFFELRSSIPVYLVDPEFRISGLSDYNLRQDVWFVK